MAIKDSNDVLGFDLVKLLHEHIDIGPYSHKKSHQISSHFIPYKGMSGYIKCSTCNVYLYEKNKSEALTRENIGKKQIQTKKAGGEKDKSDRPVLLSDT